MMRKKRENNLNYAPQGYVRIEAERAGRCFSIRQDWTDTREKHRTRGRIGAAENSEMDKRREARQRQRSGKPSTPRAKKGRKGDAYA